jgi:hypothetical protein
MLKSFVMTKTMTPNGEISGIGTPVPKHNGKLFWNLRSLLYREICLSVDRITRQNPVFGFTTGRRACKQLRFAPLFVLYSS